MVNSNHHKYELKRLFFKKKKTGKRSRFNPSLILSTHALADSLSLSDLASMNGQLCITVPLELQLRCCRHDPPL